jgi:hypothetical protein
MITNYTNKELSEKIVALKDGKFKNCKILDTKISDYLHLESNWNGCKYNTFLYLEKINNPLYNLMICIKGGVQFPFSAEGIEKAVKYINE